MLGLALTFNVLRHQQVVTIINNITEMTYPVAKDNHTGLFRQLKVNLDMTVAIYEIIYVGVLLNVFFCK